LQDWKLEQDPVEGGGQLFGGLVVPFCVAVTLVEHCASTTVSEHVAL